MAKRSAIANLALSLTARTQQFHRAMRRARRSLRRFARGVQRVTLSLVRMSGKILGVLGVGSMAAFTYAVGRALNALDDLAKTSDRLGIASKQLVALRHAAKLSGMTTEQLDKALVYLRRRVSEFTLGLSTTVHAFEALHLNARDLLGLPLERQLAIIADRMRMVRYQSDRVRVAMDLFGRGGAKMLVLLQQGSSGLDAMVDRVERLGIAFNRVQLFQVERAIDAITELRAALSGTLQRFAWQLTPYIELAVTRLTNALAGFDVIEDVIEPALVSIMAVLDQIVRITQHWERSILRIAKWLLTIEFGFKAIQTIPATIASWLSKRIFRFPLLPSGLRGGFRIGTWMLEQISAGLTERARKVGLEIREIDAALRLLDQIENRQDTFIDKWRRWMREIRAEAAMRNWWAMLTRWLKQWRREVPAIPAPPVPIGARARVKLGVFEPGTMYAPPATAAVRAGVPQRVHDQKLHELIQDGLEWIRRHWHTVIAAGVAI